MRAAELFVLLIDDHEAVTADALDVAARGFLGELARRGLGAQPPTGATT